MRDCFVVGLPSPPHRGHLSAGRWTSTLPVPLQATHEASVPPPRPLHSPHGSNA